MSIFLAQFLMETLSHSEAISFHSLIDLGSSVIESNQNIHQKLNPYNREFNSLTLENWLHSVERICYLLFSNMFGSDVWFSVLTRYWFNPIYLRIVEFDKIDSLLRLFGRIQWFLWINSVSLKISIRSLTSRNSSKSFWMIESHCSNRSS